MSDIRLKTSEPQPDLPHPADRMFKRVQQLENKIKLSNYSQHLTDIPVPVVLQINQGKLTILKGNPDALRTTISTFNDILASGTHSNPDDLSISVTQNSSTYTISIPLQILAYIPFDLKLDQTEILSHSLLTGSSPNNLYLYTDVKAAAIRSNYLQEIPKTSQITIPVNQNINLPFYGILNHKPTQMTHIDHLSQLRRSFLKRFRFHQFSKDFIADPATVSKLQIQRAHIVKNTGPLAQFSDVPFVNLCEEVNALGSENVCQKWTGLNAK